MATEATMTEQEIRQRLDQVKHDMFVGRREGQLLRLRLRIDLMRERAKQALAAGTLTEADISDVHNKYVAFSNRFRELKEAGGTSTKASRKHVSDAWDELRASLRAAREKAGLATAKAS